MSALTSSFSMMRSIKLPLCSISGMSAQQRISKVQSVEDKVYLLRYDEEADEWTLQSGFDGDELLIRPSIQLVTVDPATTKKAEQQIESCEHCHPDHAEIPGAWLTGRCHCQCHGSTTIARRHDVFGVSDMAPAVVVEAARVLRLSMTTRFERID